MPILLASSDSTLILLDFINSIMLDPGKRRDINTIAEGGRLDVKFVLLL